MSRKNNNYIIMALVLLSILLIATALFFSRETTRIESFEVGKPWLHSRLEASFQFDIELDEATRKHITDSVNQNFAKIYTLDRKKGEQQIALLSRALNGRSGSSALLQAVYTLYNNGIVDNDAANDIRAGKQLRFMVGNNELQVVDATNMKTVRQAYSWLADSMRSNPAIQEALKAVDISNYLVPNMMVDVEENEKWMGEDLRNALRSPGTIQQGEVIISRGEIVTPKKASAIESYQNEVIRRNKQRNTDEGLNLLGQILIVATLMLAFYFFIRMLRRQVFDSLRRMVFLITFITVFVIAVFLLVKFKYSLLYVIPFALVPIIVSSFFDDHTSFFVHIVTVLICSLIASSHQAEFIIMQFLAGIIAIISVKELTKRTQLVRCAAFIFLAYCTTYVAMTLINEGDFGKIDKLYFAYFLINCVILSFAFLIIPIVEKAFGFTSSMTLLELADINNPLLRQLSTNCPGTFQHSLQVANLAGEAALKIGANMQLVRAGALYHDIGKTKNPAFFTENQIGENPHDHLVRPEDSAKIVIDHVSNGLKIAEDADLPKVIKDLITQHHGKGVTRYFYYKACESRPDQEVDKTPFSYPGPNPQTKEAAILMMADACEAATKSLNDHSEESIAAMVNKIIDGQVAEGLLREAPISFRDVETVKRLFIERLRTAYHARVAYPSEVKASAAAANDAANTPPPYNGTAAANDKK
ncbi:MAG: HDIG domain-containing protein [Muribaculaceae bacterium]|nr:HDIG domain-containing protein [Muribaculaceae bacterium]